MEFVGIDDLGEEQNQYTSRLFKPFAFSFPFAQEIFRWAAPSCTRPNQYNWWAKAQQGVQKLNKKNKKI